VVAFPLLNTHLKKTTQTSTISACFHLIYDVTSKFAVDSGSHGRSQIRNNEKPICVEPKHYAWFELSFPKEAILPQKDRATLQVATV
jgi:hypothetical protein